METAKGQKDAGLEIETVDVWPVDIPLANPFRISQGSMDVARNAFLSLSLRNGHVGYGEMAPFPALTGETRSQCLEIAGAVAERIRGRSIEAFEAVSSQLRAEYPDHPSVRCGFETAMVDALCRTKGVPLYELWGGADIREYQTDITLPIGTIEEVLRAAEYWYGCGFRIFKVKVGKHLTDDVSRIHALDDAFRDVSFVVDANQGYSVDDARAMLEALGKLQCPVVAFEQPLRRHDFDGLVRLCGFTSIPICADETVVSIDDARRIAARQAADIVNLKITKSGLLETVEIARFCRANGLRLMIGGMVESRIAMACSFSLVLGLGGIELLDLDTPLLMSEDPVEGGFGYDGAMLEPWSQPGLGLRPKHR
jgi:L-alanine-DL-glutamate epimerase-like enolase superfamily enzyme